MGALCESQCRQLNCKSFMFSANKHQDKWFTGTCELYDMHNPTADDHADWECFDRVLPLAKTYSLSQGKCKAPRGKTLATSYSKSRRYSECQEKCNKSDMCHSCSFELIERNDGTMMSQCDLFDANTPNG